MWFGKISGSLYTIIWVFRACGANRFLAFAPLCENRNERNIPHLRHIRSTQTGMLHV